MKSYIRVCVKQLFVVACLFVAVAAVAQTVATNLVPAVTVKSGAAVVVNPALNPWNALIVVIVPVLVTGIKQVLPQVPKVLWPILASLLGVLADWLLAQAGATPGSCWTLGAVCGAAGVGLREATKQVMVMTNGSDTPDAPAAPVPPPSPPTPLPPPAGG